PTFERDLLPGALAAAERERRALLDGREDGAVGRGAQLFASGGELTDLRERRGRRKQRACDDERANHPGNRLEAVRLSVVREPRTAMRECQFARGHPLACPQGRV